jgi:hypothetical protein
VGRAVTFPERSRRSVGFVVKPPPASAQASRTEDVTARRFRPASPVTATVLGCVVLVLMAANVPLAHLARQSLNASGGAAPVWFSAAFGAVGLVVAWRRPGNPLGWLFLAGAIANALSQDASFYAVADYRLRHGSLPLGWVAVLAQPGWAPGIALAGLAILLFPDGQPPSRRWRWVLWVYIAASALWTGGALIASVGAIADHHIRVDASGNLLILSHPTGSAVWWGVIEAVFLPVLAVCWLGSVAAQVLSYRHSAGERRQQLKWLAGGSALAAAGIPFAAWLSQKPGIPGVVGDIAGLGVLGVPVCMGVAILRYRLFDIDRIISRTLAYALVTGLLVGVYAGLVLLATQVFRFHSTVAVAASTLAAAALFTPLRHRVQRLVDRRFNRARYDADTTVAAFAARLQDAVDLDSVRDDLAGVVQQALEPAHISVWISARE